jgi:hypothetical protein
MRSVAVRRCGLRSVRVHGRTLDDFIFCSKIKMDSRWERSAGGSGSACARCQLIVQLGGRCGALDTSEDGRDAPSNLKRFMVMARDRTARFRAQWQAALSSDVGVRGC